MGLPIPDHLAPILAVDIDKASENKIDARLRCVCEHEAFRVHLFAEVEDGVPHVASYGKDYGLRIDAQCAQCSQQHLLFDMNLHGWNGFVCREDNGPPVDTKDLFAWHCPQCAAEVFAVDICILSEGRQDFMEEGGLDGTGFTENDWVNAFGWIIIGLTCQTCGHVDPDWINFETM